MTEKFRKETALHVAAAVDDVVDHGNGNPNRKRHADKDPVAPASHEERHHGSNHNGRGKAPPELLGKRKRIGFLPAGKRSHAQKEEHRQHDRPEDRVKVRGPDRDLAGV